VVLRDERTQGDSRFLGASYSDAGDLVIEGQDLGNTVGGILGAREYEWTWTIACQDLPALGRALKTKANLLEALRIRFNGPAAAHLDVFLRESEIPYKIWSRIGD